MKHGEVASILELQDSTNALLNWFLDFRSEILDPQGEHRPRAIAAHLAACYRHVVAEAPPGADRLRVTVEPFDAEAYLTEDRSYRKPVVELADFVCKRLAPYLTHAFLHGSLATEDYARGWSDVDTFLVVRNAVVVDASTLVELRRMCLEAWPWFLQVTPLQHHGFIVATEADLRNYPSHLLPPAVLNEARSWISDSPDHEVQFNRRSPQGAQGVGVEESAARAILSRLEALEGAPETGEFRHHPHQGVYLEAEFANADDNMRQLFAYLAFVMTVPAYVLAAVGEPCYKGESFDRAGPLFSDEAWSLIERASAVRSKWADREYPDYTGNAVPEWVQEELGPTYLEDGRVLLEEAMVIIERRADDE